MKRLHLKRILRNIRKHAQFTLINFLGLTIALLIAVLTVTFVAYERSFDDFHSDKESLYRIVQENHTANGIDYWSTTAYPLAEAIRNDYFDIEVTQTAGPGQRLLSVGEGDEKKDLQVDYVLFADSLFLSFFDQLELNSDLWLQGDLTLFGKLKNSVILTDKLAKRFFGEDYGDVLGLEVQLNNNSVLSVAGIISNPPLNSNIKYEAIVNYPFFQENNPYPSRNWSGNYQGYTYVKLPKNVSTQEFELRLSAVEEKYLTAQDNERIAYNLQPLTAIHTDTRYTDSIASYSTSSSLLTGLLWMAVVIVLIAIVNYINLSSALAIKRSKEVAVYKILGDSKSQLILRHLVETSFLVILAIIHAFAFSGYFISLINEGTMGQVFDLALTQDVISIILAEGVFVIIVSGLYPAVLMSKFKPVQTLKSEQVYSSKGPANLVRKFLIFVQFSFVHIIIIGVAGAYFQLSYMHSTDLGFKKDAILTFNLPQRDSLTIERLKQSLTSFSNINAVSISSGVPFESDYQYGTAYRLSSEEETMNREAEMKVIDTDYLDFYDLEIVAGRWINEGNRLHWREGFNGFVVNETLAKELNMSPDELIGKRININEGEAEVIGVVRDYHNMWLKDEIKPLLLFYWGTGFFSKGAVEITNLANAEESVDYLERSWKKEFPAYDFSYEWMDERVEKAYAQDALIFKALQVGALIAIILGGSGLFSLVAFFAVMKTKEVGIRKTLGASVQQLIVELSSGFMKLIFLSILISTMVGWWLVSEWMNGFTYKNDLTYLTYLVSAVATVIIAGFTIAIQTLKSAQANPIDSLRYE